MGDNTRPITDATLYGLLGIKAQAVSEWTPTWRHQAGIAVPQGARSLKFVSRKLHPIGKRFEFARFLADIVFSDAAPGAWLTSTDLATSRQKFQRAFAAEFLCPISSVAAFLAEDYSEPAIEEAAAHYGVSEQTIESLLANNGHLAPRHSEAWGFTPVATDKNAKLYRVADLGLICAALLKHIGQVQAKLAA